MGAQADARPGALLGRLPVGSRSPGANPRDVSGPAEHRGWPEEGEPGVNVGLDTSVVIRLLVGRPPGQTLRAVAFLDDLARRGDRAVVSDLVLAEAYFALQHHYGVSKADALSGLRRLFADREIAPLGVAADVLATNGLASAKPGFVDRLIHRTYVAASGGRMATFERAAAKLASVTLLRA